MPLLVVMLVDTVTLTVQTHQHCVSLQLGDMDCVHLLITCGERRAQ